MTTSDEQFLPPPPYHADMGSLPVAVLLGLAEQAGVTGPPRGPCLDEVDLARLVSECANHPALREAAMTHLVTCPACRRQLATLAVLVDDPDIAAEVASRRTAPRSRRPIGVALGLAAAAAVVLIVGPPPDQPSRPAHRDPVVGGIDAPRALIPEGRVAAVPALVWDAVEGATSYRATIFDAAGTVLFEVQTPDTLAGLPDSVSLASGPTYFWKVEARTGWDRWASSELVRFQLDPRASRRAGAPGGGTTPPPVAAANRPERAETGQAPADLPGWASGRGESASVDLREAFRQALTGSLQQDGGAGALAEARQLARAQLTNWGDDFLLRELERFERWSLKQRKARVQADSVRAAGNLAYGREGPRAAMSVWHEAAALAASIPDSAGLAAAWGNIGAAHARELSVDSAAIYLVRAQRAGQAIGDPRVTANATAELAGLYEQWGDLSTAAALYSKAIAQRGQSGDTRGLAADYNNLASLARAAGDADGARQQLEAALLLNRREGRAAAAATNLVNLASLAATVGAFERAESDYREALAIWLHLADSAEAASALAGLGDLGLRRAEYQAAAESYLAAAEILDRTGPTSAAVAARQGLADALAAQGMLQPALEVMRTATEAAERTGSGPEVRAANALASADLQAQLNHLPEAERLYLAAATLYRQAGRPQGIASARHGLGTLYLARGESARAIVALDAALEVQEAGPDPRSAAVTRLSLASAAGQAGAVEQARRHLARARADFTRLGDPVGGAAATTALADMDREAGRMAAAEALYREAMARVGSRAAPDVTWRIHAGLAESHAHAGRLDAAVQGFRESIAQLERTGATLRLPERRSSWRADKWAPYQRLAELELARGRADRAFAASEALRAREMVEFLALGKLAPPRDTTAALVVREQDLRRRIDELTRALAESSADAGLVRGPRLGPSATGSRRALLDAQAEYSVLQQEIRERAPRHAALVLPAPASWRQVAARLRADEALVEYLLGEPASVAFVITRDTVVGLALSIGQQELARRVDFARRAIQRPDRHGDESWRDPLRQLYRDLIAPIEGTGLLAGKSGLIVVPHGELHYLPFSALLETDRPASFLTSRYRISMTPSATVWIQSLAVRGSATGVLAMAPHPDRLPASVAEVEALRRLGGGDVQVLTGTSATEEAFRRDAPRRRIVHLATYGVLNRHNPMFSFVDLAPGSGHDGRIEVHELFGQALQAELVVLAACQTGVASGSWTDVPPGDDWVGLARAFLATGAGAVMASLWAVEDRATGTLMEHFYEAFGRSPDPAGALAMAQRRMLAHPVTAHPYHWAGFEVVARHGATR